MSKFSTVTHPDHPTPECCPLCEEPAVMAGHVMSCPVCAECKRLFDATNVREQVDKTGAEAFYMIAEFVMYKLRRWEVQQFGERDDAVGKMIRRMKLGELFGA